MKILIFSACGIGDNLMITPFIKQLRKYRNDIEIDALGYKPNIDVLRNNPVVRRIFYLPPNFLNEWKSLKLFKKIFLLISLKKFFNRKGIKYDAVINLNKSWFSNLIVRFLFPKCDKFGFYRKGEKPMLDKSLYYDGKQNEVYMYLKLLKFFKVVPNYTDIWYDFYLKREDEIFAKKFFDLNNLNKKHVIGICPCGQDRLKKHNDKRRPPINFYLALIKKLVKEGYKVLLFGGKQNKDIHMFFMKKKIPGLFSLIGKTTIFQTVAVMKRCSCVIAHDSGCLHLSIAAKREKVIGIFGPTNEHRSGHPFIKIFCKNVSCRPCVDIYAKIPKCKNLKCLNFTQHDLKKLFKLINNLIKNF